MNEPILGQELLLFGVDEANERFGQDLGRVPSAREHDLTLRAIERCASDEKEPLPGGTADLEVDLRDVRERCMEHVDDAVGLEIHVPPRDVTRGEVQYREAH